MKLFTALEHRWGQVLNTPVGEVSIDKTGHFEIDETKGKELLSMDIAFVDAKSSSTKAEAPKKEADTKTELPNPITTPTIETSPVEMNLTVEVKNEEAKIEAETIDYSSLTVKELQEIATSADLPKEEWQKLKNKTDLIKYLLEKTN